jgi:hypothetical protein
MVFSLGVFLLHPQATYSLRLRPLDWCMILMMLVHLISDIANEGFQAVLLLRIYGEWFVPYIAGRVAIQSLSDVRGALPIAATVVAAFVVIGLVESLVKVNPLELIYGARPFVGPMPDNARFGLNRAHGPFMHSLFFGVVQVILLPWVLYFSQISLRRSEREETGSGWIAAIPLSAIGIATTLSRGPLLAVGALIYGMQTVLNARWRYVLAGIGVAAVATMLILSEQLMYGVDMLTGEHDTRVTTTINGKEYQYTSAKHREFLFLVYEYPLKHAGLIGYGTEACRGFPPKGVQVDAPDMVKAIDNAYLLYTLRFGYLGLTAFILLGLAGVYEFGRLALLTSGDASVWLAAMCSMVLTTMVLFMLVWMPQEIGYLYLFSLGAGAGIGAKYAATQQKSAPPEKRRSHRSERSNSSKSSASSSSRQKSSSKSDDPPVR